MYTKVWTEVEDKNLWDERAHTSIDPRISERKNIYFLLSLPYYELVLLYFPSVGDQ
jgi:hypothetical protein